MKSVTFAVESWFDCWREMAVLWPSHHAEIAVHQAEVPLDPDLLQYETLQHAGQLCVIVARSEGRIVGYHISIIRPHLHYRTTLHAFTDVYYIAPAYREGTTGLRLFRAVKAEWTRRGVVKGFTATKLHLDIGVLLKHEGWEHTENTHCILL